MATEEQRTRRIFVDYHENRLFKNIKKVQEGKNETKTRFLTLIVQKYLKDFDKCFVKKTIFHIKR